MVLSAAVMCGLRWTLSQLIMQKSELGESEKTYGKMETQCVYDMPESPTRHGVLQSLPLDTVYYRVTHLTQCITKLPT